MRDWKEKQTRILISKPPDIMNPNFNFCHLSPMPGLMGNSTYPKRRIFPFVILRLKENVQGYCTDSGAGNWMLHSAFLLILTVKNEKISHAVFFKI